jgi:hypothetical protein
MSEGNIILILPPPAGILLFDVILALFLRTRGGYNIREGTRVQ